MGIARSTFYDLPTAVNDDTAIVEAVAAICDEREGTISPTATDGD
jgi:putative transposase